MADLAQNISDYFRSNFGDQFLRDYTHFISASSSSYLRINSTGIETPQFHQRIKNQGIKLGGIPGLNNAYKVLEGREKIGKTLEFILGLYYIQSLSSMIPAIVLNPSPGDVVLDMCAAPGSKTTQLSELIGSTGTLYANEVSMPRLKALVHNLDKMNIFNTGVLRGKGEVISTYYPQFFDKILVDAPCSALGILQKKDEVNAWWNTNKLESITQLQLRLLVSAIKALKPGGELVYSTCTMTIEENELVLNRILKNYPVEMKEINIPVASHEGLTSFEDKPLDPSIKNSRRVLPWEIDSEGFFIAKLLKTGETEYNSRKPGRHGKLKMLTSNNRDIKRYLEKIEEHYDVPFDKMADYKYLIKGTKIYFVNREWVGDDLERFTRIGTKFCSLDSRGFPILHTHAAQIFGKDIKKNEIFLNEDELKIYLEGGIIKTREFSPGQKVIKYENFTLGTAISTEAGLKSQFPRSKRSQEILI